MPSSYSGNPVYHAVTVLPSDGDPAVAESVNVTLRALTDDAVYLNTNLNFKVDVRGGNYNSTGSVTINGTAAWTITPHTLQLGGGDGNGVLFVEYATTDIDSPTTNFRGTITNLTSPDTFIGSGATHQLSIFSSTDIFGPLVLHADMSTGHNITAGSLNVQNSADFDCSVQLTHPNTSETLNVGGVTTFQTDTRVNGVFRATSSGHLGSSSNSQWEMTGQFGFDQNVAIAGNLSCDGNVDFSNSTGLTNLGNAICGTLDAVGAVTLGDSSNDAITINGSLVGGLAMGSNGRILASTASIASNQTLNLSSSRTISAFCNSAVVLTIDDTGMLPGDEFRIEAICQSGGTITVQLVGGTPTTHVISQSCVIFATRGVGSGALSWFLAAVPRLA